MQNIQLSTIVSGLLSGLLSV